MLQVVSSDIEGWISSNTQLLDLLNQFNHGDPIKETDVLSILLSCITNAPNLQPLGGYHALRFWNELLGEDERQDIFIHLRDADPLVRNKGVAVIYALFKYYIPIVDPPLPFAVPVWTLSEWSDGQWKDMVQEMKDDSLYDTFPALSCKIRIPVDIDDPDWNLISTVCSHSEGQDVSVDVAKDVCRQLHAIKNHLQPSEILHQHEKGDLATIVRSCLSSPMFGDNGGGAWEYKEGHPCPLHLFFYPIKHANARLNKKIISLDWHVADTNSFPAIVADSCSIPKYHGEYQVCYLSIALLHNARTAIAEITESVRPQRISVMALDISQSEVKRYIFSFHGSESQTIQYWYKLFDLRKLADLGRLWLELWNSRTTLLRQFHDFPLFDWLDSFEEKQLYVSLYPALTPSSSSSRVIFSRRRSQSECVEPLDQEQRKNRVTWLNSCLRKHKYRVDKFIHANVVRIIHWTTREVVEYAKFFHDHSYELSIHRYLLTLSHPQNRTVPILRFLHNPEGYTVAFTPNAGDRLSTPSTIKRLFEITLQICQAVVFIHQHRIAHLDLKLENIMLSSDDRITIIDFSCAYNIPPPPGLIEESVGTPGYMAPEVEQGISYDPILADVYSLGWVLQYLCFMSFDPFYDIAKTMTVEDPLSRPSIAQVISHIESFISQPSLWEHIDIFYSKQKCNHAGLFVV